MNFSNPVKEKLERYCSNIVKWNKAYNLVSSSQNEKDIWERHILDSVQLYEHLPANSGYVIDLGSGAGFPAIPCSILAEAENKDIKFLMVESMNKKVNFLEDSIRLLSLKNIEAQCARIENIKDIKADIITARAFSEVNNIFEISKDLAKKDTKFILLKGKNIREEIDKALGSFSFDYQLIGSKTGDGFIFIAENVKNK